MSVLLVLLTVSALPPSKTSTPARGVVRIEATPLPDRAEDSDPTVSLTRVRSARLEAARARGEALSTVVDEIAGARVLDLGGPEAVRRVSVRGGSPSQALVLLDDVPLRLPFATGLDIDLIPAEALSEVSLARGSMAATLGSGALTGALILRTRGSDPTAAPAASVSAAYGSFDTVRFSASAGAPGVSAAIAARRTDGDFRYDDVAVGLPPETRTRINADVTRLGFFAHADTAFGVQGRLLAKVLLSGREAGLPGFSSRPNPLAREHRQLGLALLGGRYRLEGGVETALDLYFAHQDLDVVDPTPGVDLDQQTDFRGVGGQVRLSAPVGAHLLRLAVGVEESIASGSILEDQARLQVSVRVSDEWFLSEALSAFIATGLEAVSDQGVYALPRAGLRWDPVPGWTVRLGVGRGLRVPTLDELYRPPEPGLVGNPELVSETAWEGELAVDMKLGPVEAGAAAFARRIDRPILYLNRNAFVVRPENLNASTAVGLEASVFWADSFGPLGLSVDLSGSWLRARLDETGEPLPTQPEWSGFGSLGLSLFEVEALTRLRGVSTTQTRLRGNPDNDIPPYVRWDVAVSGRPVAGVEVGVQVSNLLDDRSLRTVNKLPLPGRTVMTTVRWVGP